VAEKLKSLPQTVTAAPVPQQAATSVSVARTRRAKSAENRRQSLMETLMLASWKKNDAPSSYLPSAVNNCRTTDQEIICYSDDQTRTTLSNRIKYKTKSITSGFSENGTFSIVYRNLVIDVEQLAPPDAYEEPGSSDVDTSDKGYKIKTGWGKEHRLECTLKNNTTISCLKDKIHRIELVSSQQVADRQ